MKQHFFTKILLMLLMSMVGTKALAYDIAVENADGVTIYYNYINDGTELEVTYKDNYNSYKGSVIIPEDVTYMNRTRKVTNIGELAFFRCSGLTSVFIPNSVTSIGRDAFSEDSNLTSITIGNSVTSIGRWAFHGCRGLTSINIPNIVSSIGECAFDACIGLTSVNIPNSVTSIESRAFEDCSGLTSVTIPNSVTSIKSRTFFNCSGLTSVTIPNSVTSIGEEAFGNCSGLTSVTIPNSVSNIREYAFFDCDIPEVISKIEKPFNIDASTFSNNTYLNATLYVPKGTIDKYKTTEEWKKFLYIEENNGGGDTPTTQKCSKPNISYINGKLTYNSATEGVSFKSTITDTDINSYSSNEIQLGVTYNISVYATKAEYEDSETVTATLCWIDVDPKTEGITNNVANVRALPVLIQSYGNVLNISGAPEGSEISVYNLSGQKVGSAKVISQSTDVITSLQNGDVGIVNIGEKAIKVIIK